MLPTTLISTFKAFVLCLGRCRWMDEPGWGREGGKVEGQDGIACGKQGKTKKWIIKTKKKKNIFLSKHIDIEMTPRSPPAFFPLFLRHSKCSVVLLPIFSRPTIWQMTRKSRGNLFFSFFSSSSITIYRWCSYSIYYILFFLHASDQLIYLSIHTMEMETFFTSKKGVVSLQIAQRISLWLLNMPIPLYHPYKRPIAPTLCASPSVKTSRL